MRQVAIVDTSIFCVVLGIPKMSNSKTLTDEVLSEFDKLCKFQRLTKLKFG
jgi:hypothetical protein